MKIYTACDECLDVTLDASMSAYDWFHGCSRTALTLNGLGFLVDWDERFVIRGVRSQDVVVFQTRRCVR